MILKASPTIVCSIPLAQCVHGLFFEGIFLWSLVILCSTYRYVIDTYIGVLAEFGGVFAHSHVFYFYTPLFS